MLLMVKFFGLKNSVESAMRRPPVTVLFSDKVSFVVEKMISNNIGAIIVNEWR